MSALVAIADVDRRLHCHSDFGKRVERLASNPAHWIFNQSKNVYKKNKRFIKTGAEA